MIFLLGLCCASLILGVLDFSLEFNGKEKEEIFTETAMIDVSKIFSKSPNDFYPFEMGFHSLR